MCYSRKLIQKEMLYHLTKQQKLGGERKEEGRSVGDVT